MPRKTIRVTDLVDAANTILAAEGSTPEGRAAVAHLVSRLLMDANAYRGFTYLRSEYLPADQQTDTNVLRPFYDDTRRRYIKVVS